MKRFRRRRIAVGQRNLLRRAVERSHDGSRIQQQLGSGCHLIETASEKLSVTVGCVDRQQQCTGQKSGCNNPHRYVPYQCQYCRNLHRSNPMQDHSKRFGSSNRYGHNRLRHQTNCERWHQRNRWVDVNRFTDASGRASHPGLFTMHRRQN